MKEQLRIARVNLMKRRAAQAWHRAHCERCMAGDSFLTVIGTRATDEDAIANVIAQRFGAAKSNLNH